MEPGNTHRLDDPWTALKIERERGFFEMSQQSWMLDDEWSNFYKKLGMITPPLVQSISITAGAAGDEPPGDDAFMPKINQPAEEKKGPNGENAENADDMLTPEQKLFNR